MKKTWLLTLMLLPFITCFGDEGMWLLTDLKTQNELVMRQLGLEIPIEGIYNENGLSLKDAVVRFGKGCTGSVISSQGLVITNYHCGYSSIQQLSSVEHDYLTDGFWAKDKNGELPANGLTITFIDRILEVTDYVNQYLLNNDNQDTDNTLSSGRLTKIADHIIKTQNIDIEPSNKIELKSFYGGNKFYMFLETEYKDIRLVGAPPSSIGKFGADTDNWMWPRHTGDFALFRIYTDSVGKPSTYNENNIPLKPKKHLEISLDGVDEGDFTFIMGFPGSNWRYMISDEVLERMQTTNFMRHHIRQARQEILLDQMRKDPAIRIHYASKYASSANYWKNAIGMNEGLTALNVLETKKRQQESLLAWGEAKGDSTYLKAYNSIQSVVKQRHDALFHQQAINEALVSALDFLRVPSTAALVTALKAKDKTKINQAISELTVEADKYFESVPFPEVENKVAKTLLRQYARYIPKAQRISLYDMIDHVFYGNIDTFVNACFDYSIFGNRKNFDKFIKKPTLKKLQNDFIIIAKASINEGILKTGIAMKDATAQYNNAHKTWVKGMTDMKTANGEPIYPDANSTIRLTYGRMLPYSPKDAVTYNSYTTLDGVMEKEDPTSDEFIVPQKLKELYRAKDYGIYGYKDKLRTCFIVNTDNTGGNSGSPVFNSKGQLIGLGFDRNYEGLTGDIAFHPDLQRAICVDIRYILFIIEKYAGATHIINELNTL